MSYFQSTGIGKLKYVMLESSRSVIWRMSSASYAIQWPIYIREAMEAVASGRPSKGYAACWRQFFYFV